MKIHRGLEQRSWEWFKLRAGKITASEAKHLVTPKKLEVCANKETRRTYLNRKLAEKWHGGPLECYVSNRQTDQGIFYEPAARNAYSFLSGNTVEQIGGIESDDGRLWCSPDGWLPGEFGLEIKCPNLDTQIGYLLDGCVPDEYVLQLQFSMWVTGARRWHFFSFFSDAPELFLEVEPIPKAFAALDEAANDFAARFDAAWARICELNGGPPKRREPRPPPGFGSQHIESDEQHAHHVFTDPPETKVPFDLIP